ncbi:MAG TPA: ABC transporter ATP-binding protein [Micromonosporaceae bacterium]|jgi:ABC-2 type transport system ATP-binding protein
MLKAQDLKKSYGELHALDGFTLTVEPGEIVGLIGHNGAGKTTFAEVVTGLTRPDGGTVRIAGRPPRDARARIGYAPQELGLYPTATVRQNLALFGRLYGLRRGALSAAIDEVVADLMLTEVLDRVVDVLSGGQRRRVQAATALLHRPDVLLLDEPTAGADPETRDALLAAVRRRADDGCAVCYTTHYLPELDALNATIAVAARGRVIARGDRTTLLSGLRGHATLAYPDGSTATVAGDDPIEGLVAALASGPAPTGIELHQPTIDDLYRTLTGGSHAQLVA